MIEFTAEHNRHAPVASLQNGYLKAFVSMDGFVSHVHPRSSHAGNRRLSPRAALSQVPARTLTDVPAPIKGPFQADRCPPGDHVKAGRTPAT